jgi:peptidoglycan LD-endopeptidase LytH
MLFQDHRYHHDHRSWLKRHGWWLIPLLVFDLFFLLWWLRRDKEPAPPQSVTEEFVATVAAEPAPAPPPGLLIGFPTAQTNLFATNSTAVYMPTASGRIESAFYGSTRTRKLGSGVVASFHEGIDLAPLERGKKNIPLDRILAIADGRVAYISPHPGNSNYGRYVVTVHDDPLGEIYALYAHLDEIATGLRAGQSIARGHDLGRMGSSPSHIIPVARAHLHLETGVILNQHFRAWHQKQKLKPDHRNYHGHNLYGMDPLAMYRISAQNDGRFNMRDYLLALQPAFTLLFRASERPDYYQRYAALWMDDEPVNGGVVMEVSEGGVPLRGRPASPEEVAGLGRATYAVLSVDEEVLGRNGMRLILNRQGKRILSSKGQNWLEIITYRP